MHKPTRYTDTRVQTCTDTSISTCTQHTHIHTLCPCLFFNILFLPFKLKWYSRGYFFFLFCWMEVKFFSTFIYTFYSVYILIHISKGSRNQSATSVQKSAWLTQLKPTSGISREKEPGYVFFFYYINHTYLAALIACLDPQFNLCTFSFCPNGMFKPHSA